MSKNNFITTTNAYELADVLGLSEADAAEMEFKSNLNDIIIKKFNQRKITHVDLSKKAGVSRSRVTALLNRNTQGLSVDFMIKVLSALGYRADLKVSKIA